MNLILYDICKDAIAKSVSASDEDRKLLVEAAANALMLAGTARREGLLALENAAMSAPFVPDYLKQIILLIVDGRDPEMVLEIAAGGYWRQNPQGIHALVRYFYIRGMLLAQMGENPRLTQELFVSLIPDKWREGFLEQTLSEQERKEQARQKETAEAFDRIQPSFHDEQLLAELHGLESSILRFYDGTLKSLLRNISRDMLVVCLYAFQEKTRKKIMRNVGRLSREMLMQDVVWREAVTEQDVLEAVRNVNAVLSRLRESGEIIAE